MNRCGGILLHLSSLPGKYGIGDLGPSAYRFVDWLASAGWTKGGFHRKLFVGLGAIIYAGTTLIAAQSCGRVCFGIEIDPLFVDLAIRRWQSFAGEKARRASDGTGFDVLAPEAQVIEEAS